MKKKMLLTAIAVLLVCGVWVLPVSAGIIAFTPSGEAIVPGEPSGNDALFFTPNVNITVTALGYYDGVTYDHGVGLYDMTSTDLLAIATIDGTGGSLVNDFYYNAITPVTLLAGKLYAIDGYYAGPPDKGVYATGGVGASPEITYNYYMYDYAGSGPDIPNNSYPTGIFGPNFQYSVVPDGGTTLLLLSAAMIGLATLHRKFRA
jgi:hypothetical protein